MKRRPFRPLTAMTGVPTFDQYARGRGSQKRPYTQLTLGGGVTPIPFFGEFYRYFKASSIADYESIATATWSTGTTGGTDNWNCIYTHQTVNSPQADEIDLIMNPIRFEIDAPASNGGTFDWLNETAYGTFPYPKASHDGRYGLARFSGRVGIDSGTGELNEFEQHPTHTMGIHNKLLQTNSHAVFQQDRMTHVYSDLGPVLPIRPLVAQPSPVTTWVESTLNAIQPTYRDLGANFTCTAYRVQHYVNGSLSGPLHESGATWQHVDSVALNDGYHFDVWFRIRYRAGTVFSTGPHRGCKYFPTTKVSSGTRRFVYQHPTANSGYGQTWIPFVRFRNLDYSPNFNNQEQTYSITISGHTGWTLHGGSNTLVLRNGTGLSASIGGGSITMSVDSNNPSYQWWEQLTLKWDQEIPVLSIVPGQLLRDATGLNAGSAYLGIQYAPQDSSDYRESVTSTDFGSINVGPAGTFTQDGTTTFDLIEWSAVFDSSVAFTNLRTLYSNTAADTLLPTTPDPAVPTSISVTRVNL